MSKGFKTTVKLESDTPDDYRMVTVFENTEGASKKDLLETRTAWILFYMGVHKAATEDEETFQTFVKLGMKVYEESK